MELFQAFDHGPYVLHAFGKGFLLGFVERELDNLFHSASAYDDGNSDEKPLDAVLAFQVGRAGQDLLLILEDRLDHFGGRGRRRVVSAAGLEILDDLAAAAPRALDDGVDGFDDFRSDIISARQGLDKGAIAFCVFVERELAHIGWVAMNEEAQYTFDPLPFKVDFSNREACTGGAWTNPKYRGRGLMSYTFLKRIQFLRERGILILRCSVNKKNIAPQKLHARLGANMYAEASYLKVLRWQLWKERPPAANNP